MDDIIALRKRGLRRQTSDNGAVEEPENEHALFFTLRKKYDTARKIKAAGVLYNHSRRRARSSEHAILLHASDGVDASMEDGSGIREGAGYTDSAESTAQDSSQVHNLSARNGSVV